MRYDRRFWNQPTRFRARLTALVALTVLLICASCAPTTTATDTERVLFVGNSVTYVGNTPAIVSALGAANGKPIASDMIVKGGATLSERVADGSVERALDGADYYALVLQERGGELMCSFGPDSCAESRRAIEALAELGKERGIQVFLLGTYQRHPAASRYLVERESLAAQEAGIPYVEVSETLQRLLETEPGLSWFADDGVHPGKHLALLNAVLVYRALYGMLPQPVPLTVKAPIYGTRSGLTEELRSAKAPPPLPDTPTEISYSPDTLKRLLAYVSNETSSDDVRGDQADARR